LIRYFSITSPVVEADFLRLTEIELTGKVYKELKYYQEKTERSAKRFLLSRIYTDKKQPI
jgi:preprotein translocase subunit SecA